MSPTLAPGAKTATIEFRKSLTQILGINEKANQLHHRGQIAILARQAGHPVPTQTGFGLWEWGSLWRECGYGK